MADDLHKLNSENNSNIEGVNSDELFFQPIEIDDDNRSIDSFLLGQQEAMELEHTPPLSYESLETENSNTLLYLIEPNSQNSDGLTDFETLTPHSTDHNLANNLAATSLSSSSSLDSQNSEITIDSIQGNDQDGLDFLSSKERVQSPYHQDKYFRELSKIGFKVFFDSFVKESLSSNSNLIHYLNIEAHSKLIRSMALSKRIDTFLRSKYSTNIKKLFRDMFNRIKYLYNLHKSDLLDELNELTQKEVFYIASDSKIKQLENSIDQLEDLFWDNIAIIIQEASEFHLHELIYDYIDFFPNKDQPSNMAIGIPNKQLYKHLPTIVHVLKHKPCQIVQLVDTHYVLFNIAEKTRLRHKYFQWSDVDNIFLETFLFIAIKRYHEFNEIKTVTADKRPPRNSQINIFGLHHIQSKKLLNYQVTIPTSKVNIVSAQPSPEFTVYNSFNTTDDSISYDYSESDSDSETNTEIYKAMNMIFDSPQDKNSVKRNRFIAISPDKKTGNTNKRQKLDQHNISLFGFNDRLKNSTHTVTPEKNSI